MGLHDLVARAGFLPGLYVLDEVTARDAWHVLKELQKRPGVFPHSVRYSPAQDRFVLPPKMFPDLFQEQHNYHYHWYSGLEVVPAELTAASRAYLERAIAANGAFLVQKYHQITLDVWRRILGARIQKRDDIAAVIAQCPGAVVENEQLVFPRGLDTSECEAMPIPGKDRCVLIPRGALIASPALGLAQDRFKWQWYDESLATGCRYRSERFDLADLGEERFVALWQSGRRVDYCGESASSYFPEGWEKISPAVFPLRLRDLATRFGVKASSWQDAMVAILTAQADHDAAREAARGPYHVLELSTELWASENRSRPWMQPKTLWQKPLDFLRLAFHLDLLTPLRIPAQQEWSRGVALCRLVPEREGTLLRALTRPAAEAGRFLAVWLVEVLELCS